MITLCVHSYKGGTGKTTVAIQLAIELLTKNVPVYLLETDFFMPSFYSLFPDSYPHHRYFTNELYSNLSLDLEDVFVAASQYPNLYVSFANPVFVAEDPLFSHDKEWFTQILRHLVMQSIEFKKKHPDGYLIIDTPPGYHFVVINNLLITNIALVVLRPSIYAVHGTRRIIEDIYLKTRSTRNMETYILFNQVPNIDPFPELHEWKSYFHTLGYKIVSDIQYTDETAYYSAKGLTIYPKGCYFSQSIRKLVNDLQLL